MTLRGGPLASCAGCTAVADLAAEEEMKAAGFVRRGRRATPGLTNDEAELYLVWQVALDCKISPTYLVESTR